MPARVPDVLLISSDDGLRREVESHRPVSAELVCVRPGDVLKTATVREAWVDLDGTEKPPVLRGAPRMVYFHSGEARIPESLPSGLCIQKPCAPAILDMLWMQSAAQPRSISAGKLPGWLLEFHELNLAALCRRLISGLPPRLGYRDVSLYLHDHANATLVLAGSKGPRQLASVVPLDASGQNLMAAVARTGRPFVTEHVAAELSARGIPQRADRAYPDDCCLIAPLVSDGQLWGVVNLSGRGTTALTDSRVPMADVFAFLGRAVQHARAYEQARTEARVDGLTGLYNQRWLMDSLAKEIRRAERYGTPLAVLMMDLDGLKSINDRYGHPAGDFVLRHAAARITHVLRPFDGAARVGGDEFIVLLPATDQRSAERVATRVSESLRRDPANFRGHRLPISAGIGAAAWQAGWTAAQLLEAADRAMYRAKQTARGERTAKDPKPRPRPVRRAARRAS